MCGFQGTDKTIPERNSGDYGERDPPVPIPNTEVKPFSADGTWLETARESRSLPDSKKESPHKSGGFPFWNRKRRCTPGPCSGNVQHCTWLGEPMAASGGTEDCRVRWTKQAGGASGIASRDYASSPDLKQRAGERPGALRTSPHG